MQAHEFTITSPGGALPQDNGYLLLSSLSMKFPFLHDNPSIQIAPLRGTRRQDHQINLDPHSVLHIRGLTDEQAHSMSNAWIIMQGMFMGLGEARTRDLTPSDHLVSRHVILKGGVLENEFREALSRLVPEGAQVTLGRKRGLHIKGRVMLGYGVRLSSLSSEDSLRIQQQGLGKHTSMGCGVFYPGTMNL